MATRIKEKYLAEAVPALQQKFGYKNPMQVPKLAKIVINMGLGDCKDNAKMLDGRDDAAEPSREFSGALALSQFDCGTLLQKIIQILGRVEYRRIQRQFRPGNPGQALLQLDFIQIEIFSLAVGEVEVEIWVGWNFEHG